MRKFHRIMEIFWLVMAILTAMLSAYKVSVNGLEGNYLFLAFPVICLLLYLMRRYVRRRMDSEQINDR